MKQIITLILISVLLSTSVFAALPLWTNFCFHNGYTIEKDQEKAITYCVFDDENKCPSKEFLDGSCGQEYIKPEEEIPCRGEGESLYWGTEECCEGLYVKVTMGPSSCVKLNFFQKIWYWITHIF